MACHSSFMRRKTEIQANDNSSQELRIGSELSIACYDVDDCIQWFNEHSLHHPIPWTVVTVHTHTNKKENHLKIKCKKTENELRTKKKKCEIVQKENVKKIIGNIFPDTTKYYVRG